MEFPLKEHRDVLKLCLCLVFNHRLMKKWPAHMDNNIPHKIAFNNFSIIRWESLARCYHAPGSVSSSYSFFNSSRSSSFFFLSLSLCSDFGPGRLLSGLLGDRQQSADRWFLSLAVNRPLVGELTPVTLLVCYARLPSHSLEQPTSPFPEVGGAGGGGGGPVGRRPDGRARLEKCCPRRRRALAAWVRIRLPGGAQRNKTVSHPLNICTASWRPASCDYGNVMLARFSCRK